MRILFVSPWARALARVYCDELVGLGHDVALVTTSRHFERQETRPYELIMDGAPKQPLSWPGVLRVIARARRFRPDVVVAEEFQDPRLLPLLGIAPVATLVHDDAPHDHTHVKAWHHRVVFRRVSQKADLLVTFSDFVAAAVRSRWSVPVATVALPSEAGEHQIPPFVPAAHRRDVVLIGRMGPYKNLPATFEGWAEHVASPAYRGDRLLVIGGGDIDGALPPQSEWRRGRYQFGDMLPQLAAAKASLAYYSSASQSGVQVLGMQCGTATLVSDAGGLPEYLPPGEKALPLGRPDLLAAALGELVDPAEAARRGAAGRAVYDARHHPAVAARELVGVLEQLRAGAFAPTP